MPAPAPKPRTEVRKPRQLSKAERKRALEAIERSAKRHRKTLAALAK